MPSQQLTNAIETAPTLPSLAAFKLRRYRIARNLTAMALAKELGVSDVAVLYWENGNRVPRHQLQGRLHAEGICSPNEWHEPAPEDGQGEGASSGPGAAPSGAE